MVPTKSFLVVLLASILVIHPVNGILFSVLSHVASAVSDSAFTVLEGMIGTLNTVIYTLSPNNPINVDNAGSRLLQAVAKSSSGMLLLTVQELNSTTPEIDSYRESTLNGLTVTATTPPLLRNLVRTLHQCVAVVPRSTLDNSGVLEAVPQLISAFYDLASEFTDSQLRYLVADAEDMARLLISNVGPLATMRQLPSSLVHLHDQLLAARDDILRRSRMLLPENTYQPPAITNLVSSVDVIANSIPIILQTVQNVMSNIGLNLERRASTVEKQIQEIIREILSELPGTLNVTARPMDSLGTAIKEDINKALEFNEQVIAASLESVGNYVPEDETVALLVRQISSALTALQKSVPPTVDIITSQLETLRSATESNVANCAASSNYLLTTFDGVISAVQMNVVRGLDELGSCVNAVAEEVEQIAVNTVTSLDSCAAIVVQSTKLFINKVLDDTDEILLNISHIADQMDACAELFNSNSSSVVKIRSCLQSCYSMVRKNDALTSLSTSQISITNRIDSLHDDIHTCANQALYDAENAAEVVEKKAEKCFMASKG